MENNLDNQNQDQNLDNQNQNQNQTFSKEEVDKMLQVEADKRVSQAIATAKAKWETEFKTKLDQEKEEAQRLSKLNEEERMQAELNKQKQIFEDERKQFLRERKEHETTIELSKLGLPILFAKYLIDESDEVTNANIKKLQEEFQKSIEEEVNKRLQGTTPKGATKTDGSTITKEQFNKMSITEKAELYNQNKELYTQLRG
jgi:Domain of unknown function (DUF4355)